MKDLSRRWTMKHSLWHSKRAAQEKATAARPFHNVIIFLAYLQSQGQVYCAFIETDKSPVNTYCLACLFKPIAVLILSYTSSSDLDFTVYQCGLIIWYNLIMQV